jgi:hypothetical protein
VFDRPGSDRWNLASTAFPDAGPMVRIRFPPAESQAKSMRERSAREVILRSPLADFAKMFPPRGRLVPRVG